MLLIGFNRRGCFNRGRRGWSTRLSRADGLWIRIGCGQSVPGIVTFVGTVAFLPAMEAESFLDMYISLPLQGSV